MKSGVLPLALRAWYISNINGERLSEVTALSRGALPETSGRRRPETTAKGPAMREGLAEAQRNTEPSNGQSGSS